MIKKYRGLKCRNSPKKSELVLLIEEDNKAKQLDESQQHKELEKMRCEKEERLRLEEEQKRERRISNELRKIWAERDVSREYERRELREAIRLGSTVRLDVGFSDRVLISIFKNRFLKILFFKKLSS